MPSDRFYMRGDYPRSSTTALVWLVAATIATYVLQLALRLPWFEPSSVLAEQLRLTVRGIERGHVWTLVTHAFLHSTANPLHFAFSLLGLILLGRELEPQLGARRFAALLSAAVIAGAICWLAVHWQKGGIHLGMGAGILGLLVVLARLYDDQRITLMPLFLFTITVRPMHFIYGLMIVDASLLAFELGGARLPFDYTPSAHLGGLAAGWVYFRCFHAGNGWDRAPGFSLPRWLRRSPPQESTILPPAIERPPRAAEALRADVDRILDKINSEGFASLTAEEKRTLDEAKSLASRR